jgi:hypothetical protein
MMTNSPVHLDCSENCALTRLNNDDDRALPTIHQFSLQSLCPHSAHFLALTSSLVRPIVGYVIFFGGAMVYLFICLQSLCCLRLPISFVLIHGDFWAFFSTSHVYRLPI